LAKSIVGKKQIGNCLLQCASVVEGVKQCTVLLKLKPLLNTAIREHIWAHPGHKKC